MKLRRVEEQFELMLTETELNAVHSGLAETLEALQDWEFQTRTGMEREEMRTVLRSLRDARDTLAKGGPESDG